MALTRAFKKYQINRILKILKVPFLLKAKEYRGLGLTLDTLKKRFKEEGKRVKVINDRDDVIIYKRDKIPLPLGKFAPSCSNVNRAKMKALHKTLLLEGKLRNMDSKYLTYEDLLEIKNTEN